MPRTPEVDQHKNKKQIINALIRGDTYRKISEKYDISQAALCRYMKKTLMERAAKAEYQRELKDGETILKAFERIIWDLQKMLDACKEYLQDPEDPNKYYLGPQAQEITVGYWTFDEDKKRGPVVKEKLDVLLDEIRESGRVVTSVQYKHADPRNLLIQAADAIGKQLKTVSEIYGLIKSVNVNITQIEQWVEIKTVILQATEKYPEVRKKIADGLTRLTGK